MNQKELQAFFDELVRKNGGKEPSIEEINKHFAKFVEQHNDSGMADFEGYSPEDMGHIRSAMLSQKSPVKFCKLTSDECREIPIFRQAKYLLGEIVSQNGIKLTVKGNLPLRLVAEMHLLAEKPSIHKAGLKEYESLSVSLTRELLSFSGLIKKLHNKLELTNKGKKMINDDNQLLTELFVNFTQHFDWSSLDGYDLPDIATDGWEFSVILVGKYGDKLREDTFYAEKYFKAFSYLLAGITGWNEALDRSFGSKESYCTKAYVIRTFSRFMKLFGLVTLEDEDSYAESTKVKKTPLFDKFIKILPPGVSK